MELSDALLRGVIACLEEAEPGGAERRREARTQLVGRAMIIPCGASGNRQPVPVGVRDVSPRGMAIVHTAALAVGERFILILSRQASELGGGIVCGVAHCRAMAGGLFLIGAAFQQVVQPRAGGRFEYNESANQPAPSLPVDQLLAAFRQQARSVLTPEESKLLMSIERRLTESRRTAPPTRAKPPEPAAPAAAAPAAAPRKPGDVRRLLTREDCVQRAEKALEARTLSGIVAQVITMATSPRGELSDLAALVTRDPILSARVLQAANSVGYASTRRVVSSIAEAVRNIGCTGVRDIATALGVFDAMPPSSGDGFNPIRCWQHSFAAAMLSQRLVPEEQSGLAYVVGLCHDLGEILFHTHFAEEYRQLLEAQQATGKRRDELERVMLGTSHGELVQTILRCLGLPESIRMPIQEYHAGAAAGRLTSPLARVLRLADLYANGTQLASSGDAPVTPLTRADVRAATGQDAPPRPDGMMLRGEIFALTAMLARLSPKEEAALMAQPFERRPLKMWLARDPGLSAFDPVHTALESICDVTASEALPRSQQLAGHHGLVVVARSATATGFSGPEIAAAAGALPALWLSGHLEGGLPAGAMTPKAWPVPLASLAEFIRSCQPAQNVAVVAA